MRISILFYLLFVSISMTSQNVGVNLANPQFPLHVQEPLGFSLQNDQPIIFGEYTNTTTLNDVIAIKGLSKPGDYYGIGGSFEGGWYGVQGKVLPTGAANYTGVSGFVNGGTGTNFGIFGSAQGTGINWAGYFDAGNVYITNRLGIGQNNPLWPFDLSATQAVARFVTTTAANGSVIELKNTAVSPTYLGAINFNNLAGTNPGQIAYESDHELTFRADGVERMKIDKYGNLNIGTGTFLGVRLNIAGGIGRFLGGVAAYKNSAGTDNIAIYGDASGASNNNWAGYFSNGNVHIQNELRIGTSTGVAGYKVAIHGKVICEELKVQLQANWPDYVFKDGYNLKTLEALENEIQIYGHLPGIPSASVVEKEGILIGEMQRILLEKVEELTLYVIQLKKENEKIQFELELLKQNKSEQN